MPRSATPRSHARLPRKSRARRLTMRFVNAYRTFWEGTTVKLGSQLRMSIRNVRLASWSESGVSCPNSIKGQAKTRHLTYSAPFRDFPKILSCYSMRSRRRSTLGLNAGWFASFCGSPVSDESRSYFLRTAHSSCKSCRKRHAFFFFRAHWALASCTAYQQSSQ
jgi:hypothetical protein